MSTGTALRTLREAAGITIREVAASAGVSESYLSRVETGQTDASPEWIGTVAGVIAESMRTRAVALAEKKAVA